MLKDVPPIYRKREPRVKSRVAPPPPAALTLVAASFDDAIETLTMTFDRAISIDGYSGLETQVNVPSIDVLYVADSRMTLSPDGRTLASECEGLSPSTGPTAWLSVPAGAGIVDAATGSAWAGCERLALPFHQ